MKYLTILFVLLSGCSTHFYEEWGETYIQNKIHTNSVNPDSFKEPCIELGKCMEGTYNLVHFKGQYHAPYACEVRIDSKRAYYFYPDADLSFGTLDMDYFKNALTVCQMLKKKGPYSDKYIKEEEENIKEWVKRRHGPVYSPKPQIKTIEK